MAEILKSKITISRVIKLVVFLVGMASSAIAYYWSNKNTQLEFEYKMIMIQKDVTNLQEQINELKNKKWKQFIIYYTC